MSCPPALPTLDAIALAPRARGAGTALFALATAALLVGCSLFVFGLARTLHDSVLLRFSALLLAVVGLRRAQTTPGSGLARCSRVVEAVLFLLGALLMLAQARATFFR